MDTTTTQTDTAAKLAAEAKAERERLAKVFGNGRLSHVCMELYRDCQNLLGMSPAHAERVASCLEADYGRLIANQKVASLSVGKLSKKNDGQVTIKAISDKLPKVGLTFSLACVKTCELLQTAKAYGVVESYDTITLKNSCLEWLNKK